MQLAREVWRCGGVEVWRCGGVEVWRCGGVEMDAARVVRSARARQMYR